MALTRPKIWDLDTNIEYFKDPLTTLHQGATTANVDVGFIFNRANGLVSNVALYWSESAQSIVTAYTSSTGVTDTNVSVTSYANITTGALNVAGPLVLTSNTSVDSLQITGTATRGGAGYHDFLSVTNLGGGTNITKWFRVDNAGTLQIINSAYTNNIFNLTDAGTLTVPAISAGGTTGISGQVLSSTGTGLQWVAAGGFSGGTVAGQTTFTSNLIASSGTASTSTTTGAMVVVGGTGISGDAYYGGDVIYGPTPILNGSSTITSVNTGAKLLDSFAATAYRSAKYILSITDVTNTAYQTSEIILMQDGTNASISSYGLLYSGTSAKMTFSSNIISGNVMLWGTGVSANNTVKLARTLIPA